jgi:uncharacterized protein (TIGR04255 family)
MVQFMTLRTLPRQKLDKSPLVQVLAQAVFSSPVLALPKYLPDIHDALRRLGLTETELGTETEIVFSVPGGPQSRVDQLRWTFYSPDRLWAVVLSQELVVLHTSRYDTFEGFVERWEQVLELVFGTVGIERVQRIGLRYTDRVIVPDAETPEDYVIASLLGYPRERESVLGARRIFARSDTVLQTDAGVLSIRCVEGQGLALPPDLQPSVLDYGDVPPPDARVLLLDFDHARTSDASADRPTLLRSFWDLHGFVDGAFRDVATPYALKVWRQEIIA